MIPSSPMNLSQTDLVALRPPQLRGMAVVLLLLLAFAPFIPAASVFSPTMQLDSHMDIRVESWLETLPSCGFVPLTIHVTNDSAQAHTWSLVSSDGGGVGGGQTLRADLTVEPGRTGERTVYAPVKAQTNRGYHYGSLTFNVEGYGVLSGPTGSVNHSSSYSSNRTAFIGMSKKVAAKHWSGLRSKLDTSGSASASSRSDLNGSEVDTANAPDDWRGYAGLAQLWMDESEWMSLRPAAKAAMLDWVAMGGRVYVMVREDSEARAKELGLPPLVRDSRMHGIGEVLLAPWDGSIMSLDIMAREVRRGDTMGFRDRLDGYDKPWGLRTITGDLTLKSGLVFGFIAIFGILVGPVNLFWLAPAGRRQRMFWTTPLLSLGGSLLLMGIIVLQDGIGGSGARLTLAIMQPGQKSLAMMQEQVSRTGVLLGRGFPISEPGWMQPLDLESSGSFNPLRERRYTYSESDLARGGDWFSSRSVQAHLMVTVRPSRAAIEVFAPAAAGQAPSVLSNVESSLKMLFVLDENDRVWIAEDVGTGEKKITKPSSRAQFDAWMREGPVKEAGPVVNTAMSALGSQKGCVIAEVTDASKFAVPTLSSVRWTHDQAIIAGPYLKR